MFNRRYKEVAGILLLLIAIVLILSLSSYSSNDINLIAGGMPVKNIIGILGAYESEFLRGAFGYMSFITVIIFAISGWSFLKKGMMADALERILSLLYLMTVASALISLIYKSPAPHFSGGYTGQFLAKLFTEAFNQIGAFIVILVLNIIGLVLCGVLSISLIIDDLGKKNINFITIIKFPKKVLKKLFHFDYKKSLPLNEIDEAINTKGKKKPWIIKKKIIIGDFDFGHGKDSIKLLEHTMPENIESPYEDLLIKLPEFQPLSYDGYVKDDYTGHYSSEYFSDIAHTDNISDDVDNAVMVNDNDDMEINSDYSFPENNDPHSEPSYINYTEDETFNIKTNRIKSADFEDEEQMITGESVDDYPENEEVEEAEENRIEPPILLKKTTDTENNAYEKPASYIPKVFENIAIGEEYSVPTNFLESSVAIDAASWKTEAKKNSELLVKTLSDFGIEARVINVHRGPVITLYEIQIAPGIKVNRIVGLSDDIAMALAAYRVRVVAPIPGKSAIGVEIPNTSREMVTIGDIIKSEDYQTQSMKLKVGLGKDILGKVVALDIQKQPHLLISGATGSGKSICLNSIVCDLIFNYDPNYVRFILIDPKMVELQLYNGLPHLLTPVITESYIAPKALKWATIEMERRYKLLSEVNARDIEKYNERIKGYEDKYERLPYIVIVIDELADLMMIAAKEIEGSITRIAQKARAVGIHLILATQRPSVDIITGIIKANFPARIAFQVAQKIDSRTILDQNGAEALLGKGDMLYQSPVSSFPVRVQGAFITEEEIMKIVKHTRKYGKPKYVDIEDIIEEENEDMYDESDDELFVEALKIVEETKKASASYLQRRLSIGYNRSARIIELMEERGYIGPQQGSKPREVYI